MPPVDEKGEGSYELPRGNDLNEPTFMQVAPFHGWVKGELINWANALADTAIRRHGPEPGQGRGSRPVKVHALRPGRTGPTPDDICMTQHALEK